MTYYIKAVFCRSRGQKGQGLVDYSLICSLVAVLCIGALSAIGVDTISLLGRIVEKFAGVAA